MEAASRPKVSTADNAEVATKLADCYLQISAEGRRVFEDPDLRVEAPLHSSSDSLFPALHRALRCGDDNVQPGVVHD